MKWLSLTFLFASLTAHALSGSWSDSSAGGSVSVGKQILVSRPLNAPGDLPASAVVTRLAWRIELLSPPPPGLRIKLCTSAICFPLAGLSGVKQVPIALSAKNRFRFVYSVESRGTLSPALQVVSNRLTLNYST
ncbi:flagellar protein FlhE [Candidatus Pantoea deserta]|uniref:Flagellar protein FlhE n=1 Tax=Candidatus Pantoea deserta TaxID=1869313 RepID=A0A3N4PYP7_9GAMM|nr:flagellar protein FlhE [Pantoea deserta]RPE04624.1 flagellar protein FlhE [Pantoea deserta]